MSFDLDSIPSKLAALPSGAHGPKRGHLAASLVDHGLTPVDCWPWSGRIARNGYGLATRPMDRTSGTSAHRLVYEILVGPVPDGWHVDHLCHNPNECGGGSDCPHRACVNPLHLEAVSPKENARRGVGSRVACNRGHPFTAENTYTAPDGKRACRTCQRAHWRRYAAEARGAS